MSVVALLMSSASASAASDSFWSNFYVSVFGGAAAGTGSVDATGVLLWDPENNCTTLLDPEYCAQTTYDMTGTVGRGLAGGVAIGTNLGPNMRGEAEMSFAHLSTNTTFTQSTIFDPEAPGNPSNFSSSGSAMDQLNATFMFGNIWYDVPLGPQVTGYVGGGAGFARVSGMFSAPITGTGGAPSTNLSLVAEGFAPAVQVGAGITYDIAPNIRVDFGYRFKEAFGVAVGPAPSFDSSLIDASGSKSMNLGVHVLQVGLSFALN
jgi:opacity protein-like surface antigen